MLEAGPEPLGSNYNLVLVTPLIIPGTAIYASAPTRKKKQNCRLGKMDKVLCDKTLCFPFFEAKTHVGTWPDRDGLKDRDKEELQ